MNKKRKDYEESLDMSGGEYYMDELDSPRKQNTKKGVNSLKKGNDPESRIEEEIEN